LSEDVCQETEERSVLLDKRYVATLNDRKGFWPRLHLVASQQGVLSCKDVVRYLDQRKDFMDYPRYRDAGFPIASAAIESTNKRLVSRRLKQGGMIWGWKGLEAMVAIRVAFYNRDRWIQLWPHTTTRAAA
jgi:hypothetical protein